MMLHAPPSGASFFIYLFIYFFLWLMATYFVVSSQNLPNFLPQARAEWGGVPGARAARVRHSGGGEHEGPHQVPAPGLRHAAHGGGRAHCQGGARGTQTRRYIRYLTLCEPNLFFVV